MPSFETKTGDVWVIFHSSPYRGRMRRVLGILTGTGGRPRVVYSDGSDRTARDCYLESFAEWARKADLVHRG